MRLWRWMRHPIRTFRWWRFSRRPESDFILYGIYNAGFRRGDNALPGWSAEAVPTGDVTFTWEGPPTGYAIRMMDDGSWWKRDDSGDWVPLDGEHSELT